MAGNLSLSVLKQIVQTCVNAALPTTTGNPVQLVLDAVNGTATDPVSAALQDALIGQTLAQVTAAMDESDTSPEAAAMRQAVLDALAAEHVHTHTT